MLEYPSNRQIKITDCEEGLLKIVRYMLKLKINIIRKGEK